MFFTLLIFSKSLLLEFNEQKFKELVENSRKSPFFVIFYTPTCTNCKDIENIFNSLPFVNNKNGIASMLIDCHTTTIYKSLNLETIPIAYFIDTNKRRYWKQLTEINYNSILSFISENSKFNIQRANFNLSNQTDFTQYHIYAQSETDLILKNTRKLSKSIAKSNKFTYTINQTSNSNITAFLGNGICNISSRNTDELHSFYMKTRFSPFHYFDDEEIFEMKRNPIVIVYLCSDFNTFSDKFIIDLQKKFCDKIIIGYSTAELSPNLLNKANLTINDLPVVVSYYNDCTKIYLGRFFLENANEFINDLFDSTHCVDTYGKREMIKSLMMQENNEDNNYNIIGIAKYPFETVLFIALSLIYYIIQRQRSHHEYILNN